MSQAAIDASSIKTLADLRDRMGGIPLDRIWVRPAPGTATDEDVLEAEQRDNWLCELVDGTLVEKAMGFSEARLATRLAYLISSYLEQNDLGICVGADGMMRIAPGLVRIPDLSFIAWDELPNREAPREPIPELVPDLAVEVLSEGNTEKEMDRKVHEYLEAVAKSVWLIDPKKRTARTSAALEKSVLIRADQHSMGATSCQGSASFYPTYSIAAGSPVDLGCVSPQTT